MKQSVENNTKRTGGVTGKGFMPGKSGNPGGRPKKLPLTAIYEEILADVTDRADIKDTVRKIVKQGRMSAVLQLREMAERVEGKVTQSVQVDGEISVSISERLSKGIERKQSR